MSVPFIGEVRTFGFTFAPRGWMDCDGSLLEIASYDALFTVIGTTYGGNGQTHFALPDLRFRVPIHAGEASPAGMRRLGEVGGAETVALHSTQVPLHDHDVRAGAGRDSRPRNRPGGTVWADSPVAAYAAVGDPLVDLVQTAVSVAGEGQPHNNMPPFLALRFCIAVEGVFPSRT